MDCNVLNSVLTTPTSCPPPSELALTLQRTMLRMKGDHMTEDGRGVDYDRLRESQLFSEYTDLSSQLVGCDPTSLDEPERKAFFINVYNSLTIHGLASKVPSSVLDVQQFWRRTAYSIGGLIYSLDDIEHGILRGNKPHPSADKPPFPEGDPRIVMSLKSCDPRIHFALVCGAKSCPAIQVYSGQNIEHALDLAAASFCEQEVEVSGRQVTLSKIFSWYAGDFGSSDRELLQWVCKHLSGSKQEQLKQLLSDQEPIEIKSKEYNWKLNKV